jgi:predicted aconitase with swiveling domain
VHTGSGEKMMMKGRKISKGKISGTALVSEKTISFYGGVDPNTGVIVEKGHDLEGKSIAGKVFVFPKGSGSTVGSYTLLRLKKNGKAPLAIVNRECETIVAVGAIISDIPCVDNIEVSKIKTGQKVKVDGDSGTVELLA